MASDDDQSQAGDDRRYPGRRRNPDIMVFLGIDLDLAEIDHDSWSRSMWKLAEGQPANAQNNQDHAQRS